MGTLSLNVLSDSTMNIYTKHDEEQTCEQHTTKRIVVIAFVKDSCEFKAVSQKARLGDTVSICRTCDLKAYTPGPFHRSVSR